MTIKIRHRLDLIVNSEGWVNPKHQILNPKQFQMLKIQNSKHFTLSFRRMDINLLVKGRKCNKEHPGRE